MTVLLLLASRDWRGSSVSMTQQIFQEFGKLSKNTLVMQKQGMSHRK
jgi:hypothetical protein